MPGPETEADSRFVDQFPPETAPPSAAELPAIQGYELLGVLGRGGMGVVYKARQVGLNRVAALKMIHAGGHAGPEQVARFRTEAEASARLHHPHIVQVFEVGETRGQPFLSMEYVAGGGLDQSLRGIPQSPAHAAAFVRQLAEAVDHAHQHGVVHRDLKPANILLAEDGTPKIADFGLAKQLDADSGQTRSGAIVGTPGYMAPEQASGGKAIVGRPADIYALGAILYEMLTGRPPFWGETVLETLEQVVARDPVPPRQLQPKVPVDLETICLKCLHKDQDRRYVSARALADDLQRFLSGSPVQARPVGSLERLGRWCRRNPAVATLLVAVAGALVVGTAVSAFFAVQAEQRAIQVGQARDELQKAVDEKQKALDQLEPARREAYERAEKLGLERQKEQLETIRAKEQANQEITQARNREQLVARTATYAYRLGLAQSDLRDFNFARIDALLADCPKNLRGWEYHHLDDLRREKALVLRGHANRTDCAAFSPDGKYVVSGGSEGEVFLWDAATGRQVDILIMSVFFPWAHRGGVRSVCFSPDGKRVASASEDKVVRVWDVARSECVFPLEGHKGSVAAVVYGPKGDWLATAGADGVVRLWDAATGKEKQRTRAADQIRSLAVSPDGRRLASGHWDGKVRVWDVETFQEVKQFEGHNGPVLSVAYHPEGDRIVSANIELLKAGEEMLGLKEGSPNAAKPGRIKVWNARTAEEISTLRPATHYPTLGTAWSPDGKRLATAGGSDTTVRLWDATSGQNTLVLRGHESVVAGVAFSPDGKRVASTGNDGTVRLWDVSGSSGELSLTDLDSPISCATFLPDGRRFVTGSFSQAVQVWDAETGKLVRTFEKAPGQVYSMALTPDEKSVAVAGCLFSLTEGKITPGEVWLYDVMTGRPARKLKPEGHALFSVAVSRDGKHLAAGGSRLKEGQPVASNGEVLVWDLNEDRPPRVLGGHEHFVLGLAFSPDGTKLASGSIDRTVRLWDKATGKELLCYKGHRVPGVRAVAFSPDGKLVASAGGDTNKFGEVRLWEAATGEDRIPPQKGHLGMVSGLAFSPDGTRLVTVGGNYGRPGEVKLWDTATGQELLDLYGHESAVNGVCFSRDGRRLVTVGGELMKPRSGEVKVWDAGER
jgi:WD40 repeat protein